MENGKELLFSCLKRDQDGKKPARLRSYSPADWEAVAEMAAAQKVLPNLHHSLKPYSSELNIPAPAAEKIRSAYYGSAARNMEIYDRLFKALDLFADSNLQVILLKGAHLAELVYNNLALRPMSDLDLLAKTEDLAIIHELLIGDGYEFPGKKAQSDTKHLPPYRKEGGVIIEIHYHIANPPYSDRISITDLWNRSQTAGLHNREVRILSPEDLLLHLCQHTCIQHGFDNGLISVLDAARVMERYSEEIDWDLLLARADQWGIKRAVILILMMVEKIEGFPLPEPVRNQLEDKHGYETALATAEELIMSRKKERAVKTTRYLARLFDGKDWQEKLSYIRQRLLPSGEVSYAGQKKVADLSLPLKIQFYLKRTFVRFKRYGKTVWFALRRDPQTILAIEEENRKNRLRDWMDRAGS